MKIGTTTSSFKTCNTDYCNADNTVSTATSNLWKINTNFYIEFIKFFSLFQKSESNYKFSIYRIMLNP